MCSQVREHVTRAVFLNLFFIIAPSQKEPFEIYIFPSSSSLPGNSNTIEILYMSLYPVGTFVLYTLKRFCEPPHSPRTLWAAISVLWTMHGLKKRN